MKKALILGAGFAGSTISYLLNKDGWDCTIIEKENYIGGGCKTFFYGGHPYTNGPRPYYGYSERIFNWIDSFVKMRKLPFSLLSYVEQDGCFYSYPIHKDDLPKMKLKNEIQNELENRKLNYTPSNFEDYWINNVGKTLYDMFVNQYSKKMWGLDSNKKIDTFNWSAKDNPINSGSKECYKGSIIGYPISIDGYNDYFQKMIKGSKLILNETVKNIDLEKKTLQLSDGTKLKGDIIVSSIPLEELNNYSLGPLPYMGREFIVFVLPTQQIFPDDIRFCHYTQNEPYTRIVEYKKLTYYDSRDTLLGIEMPSKKNKLYPLMVKEYINLANQYLKLLPENVYSIGRAGTYKYSTIEQTISQAFAAARKITNKSANNLDEEFYNIGDVSLIKRK